jgi:hypothetical protein
MRDFGRSQHADLHRVHADIGGAGIDLRGDHGGGKRLHPGDAQACFAR